MICTRKIVSIFFLMISFMNAWGGTGITCAKAKTPIEKAICKDAKLSTLDSKLAALYSEKIKNLDKNVSNALKLSQKYWLKERDFSCEHSIDELNACLVSLYTERLEVLEGKEVWKAWSSDGKTGPIFREFPIKPQTTLLDGLEDNILEIHFDLAWEKKEKKSSYKAPKFEKQFVGMWNGFKVYDVNDSINHLITIVLEINPKEFRVIYSLMYNDDGLTPENIAKTVIRKTKDGELLEKKQYVYKSERYETTFILDPYTRKPILIDYNH